MVILDYFMLIFRYGFAIVAICTVFLLLARFILSKPRKHTKGRTILKRITNTIIIINLSFIIVGISAYYLRPLEIKVNISEDTFKQIQSIKDYSKDKVIESVLKSGSGWYQNQEPDLKDVYENSNTTLRLHYIEYESEKKSKYEFLSEYEKAKKEIGAEEKLTYYESNGIRMFCTPINLEPTSFIIPVEADYCYADCLIQYNNVIIWISDSYAELPSEIKLAEFFNQWGEQLAKNTQG